MFKQADLVALDVNTHASLRLAPISDYAFAARTHAVPLAGSEFLIAAREYPIVFIRRADGSFLPTAMLGFRAEENLYVNDAGHWDAEYIPFYVRRFPFATVDISGKPDAVVCLDQSCLPRLAREEGLPVFSDGQPSGELQALITRLSEFRDEGLRAGQWCKLLADQQLFKEVSVNAQTASGETVSMEGMWVIDDSKLAGLSAAIAHQWLGNGLLALIHAHLLSLGNLQRLAMRLGQLETPAAAQTPPSTRTH